MQPVTILTSMVTYILYSIWVLAFLVVGVSLAFFPGKFSEFWNWYGKLGRFSRPDLSWKPGLGFRLAGLAMIVFVAFMLRPVIWAITKAGHERIARAVDLPIHPYAFDWPNLAFGILLTAGGLFFMLKPLQVGVWFASRFLHRSVPIDAARSAKEGMRLMGCLFIAGGIYLIYLVIKV